MDLFDKVTRQSNGPSSKIFYFFLKQLKGPMPLVQRLFSFENFTLFWERFGNLEIFIFYFFNIYMNKVHQMLRGFLEFKEI